eukprot:CAMPEP_0201482036 /NCGR_PEP_ID=MMETSP0151_2-20130828/6290_1 /ASSEMBLY_ACC=CAM_ASM_000257 /TAXON_ID=200890 /ORGANISM="Paramoeba atlantica, Strain 621/1 / CCAP 1560/9" /LENGTH=165 /DNA_ID=CAMNT_0047864503 /DNA_START=6 /DNA_END=503 /DNA_ORIENTATION=+
MEEEEVDFDALLNLENDFYQKGRQEAREMRAIHDFREGWKLGLENGYDVGFELGQYYAVCLVWEAMLSFSSNPGPKDRRRMTAVKHLRQLLESVPLDLLHPSNKIQQRSVKEEEKGGEKSEEKSVSSNLSNHVQKIKSKYKQCASLLGDPLHSKKEQTGQADLSF